MRLLVGEDNPGDARLIVEALRENPEPTSVDVIPDGDQVLKYLRRVGAYTQAERPDLLLLDLHLPKTNGLDVIRAIRTTSELSALPICVFTGSLSETERDELLALGVEHITPKPLDLREYFAVVNELLVWWRQRQSREA
jgi:DNA-binding response OmpR family regulator